MVDMTEIYGKGYQRIYEETIIRFISRVENEELRGKLKILLSFFPEERRGI